MVEHTSPTEVHWLKEELAIALQALLSTPHFRELTDACVLQRCTWPRAMAEAAEPLQHIKLWKKGLHH